MENKFENENLMDNENEEVVEEIIDESEADDTAEVTKSKKKEKSMAKELLEWVVAFVVAVVLALIIRTFFFTLVAVDGQSMDTTLNHGDRLVVSRFNYTPEQGDIIVFTPDMYPDRPFIKRVIATEGQTVDIDSRGVVYVDDKVYDEDYIIGKTELAGEPYGVKFPITVPEDCVFVMGDNRTPNGSHDGRSLDVSSIKENPDEDDYYTFAHSEKGMMTQPIYYGCVHEDDIMGKAVFRFWPFGRFGGLK